MQQPCGGLQAQIALGSLGHAGRGLLLPGGGPGRRIAAVQGIERGLELAVPGAQTTDVLHDLSGFRAQAVQLDLQLVRLDAGRLGAQALDGLTVAGFAQGRFDALDLVLDLSPLFRAGNGRPQLGHVVDAGGNPQRLQQGIDLDLLLPGCFQGLTVAGLLLLQPVMLGLVLAGGLQSVGQCQRHVLGRHVC